MTQGAVRVWEKGKRSWKRFCALALAAVLLWSMLPVTPARAEGINRITFTSLEYDMGEQTLKVAVSTEAADKYLAYYVDNRSVTGEMTNEQKFEAAVKTGTTSAEVVCPVSKISYAWYVDGDGNCLSNDNSSGRIRLNDLLRTNPQLKDPNRIYPGQRLTIPVQ